MLFAYLKNLNSYFVCLASESQSKTNVTIVSLAGFDRAARPPPLPSTPSHFRRSPYIEKIRDKFQFGSIHGSVTACLSSTMQLQVAL
jgi:hypothetical protein